MINVELQKYVRQELTNGISSDAIKATLVASGWQTEDIDLVINQETSAIFKSESDQNGFRKKHVFLIILLVIFTLIGGVSIASYYFFPNVLNKIQMLKLNEPEPLLNIPEEKNKLEEVYSKYCNYSIPIGVKSSGLNIKSLNYDDIKNSIQTAYTNNDYEGLELIRIQLFSLLSEANLESTGLGREAIQKLQINDPTLVEVVDDLHKKFQAFRASKFTSSYYTNPVYIDGEVYRYTEIDMALWDYVYDNFFNSTSAQQLTSEQRATEYTANLNFLALISILNGLLLNEEAVLDRREVWLEKTATLIATTSIESMLNDLLAGEIINEDLGLVLGIVGYRKMREAADMNSGLPLLQCAAEVYYDDLAMHHLGDIYTWEESRENFLELTEKIASLGTTTTLEAYSIFLTEEPLPLDYKKALLWLLAAETVDKIKHNVFSYGDTSFGWNNIGKIDRLVNRDYLTTIDMLEVECELGIFINQKYPELASTNKTDVAQCKIEPGSFESIQANLQGLKTEIIITLLSRANDEPFKEFPVGNCTNLSGTLFENERIINKIKLAAGGDENKATCASDINDYFAISIPIVNSTRSVCIDINFKPSEIEGSISGTTCE